MKRNAHHGSAAARRRFFFAAARRGAIVIVALALPFALLSCDFVADSVLGTSFLVFEPDPEMDENIYYQFVMQDARPPQALYFIYSAAYGVDTYRIDLEKGSVQSYSRWRAEESLKNNSLQFLGVNKDSSIWRYMWYPFQDIAIFSLPLSASEDGAKADLRMETPDAGTGVFYDAPTNTVLCKESARTGGDIFTVYDLAGQEFADPITLDDEGWTYPLESSSATNGAESLCFVAERIPGSSGPNKPAENVLNVLSPSGSKRLNVIQFDGQAMWLHATYDEDTKDFVVQFYSSIQEFHVYRFDATGEVLGKSITKVNYVVPTPDYPTIVKFATSIAVLNLHSGSLLILKRDGDTYKKLDYIKVDSPFSQLLGVSEDGQYIVGLDFEEDLAVYELVGDNLKETGTIGWKKSSGLPTLSID